MSTPKPVREMNAAEYAAAKARAIADSKRDAEINRRLIAEIDRYPRDEPAAGAQADARTLSPVAYLQARQAAIRGR